MPIELAREVEGLNTPLLEEQYREQQHGLLAGHCGPHSRGIARARDAAKHFEPETGFSK